jgi:hypothetical protein
LEFFTGIALRGGKILGIWGASLFWGINDAAKSAPKKMMGVEYSYQAVIPRRGFPSQTKTFDTKGAAQKWARMIERDMDRGAWRDSSAAERSTLGDVLRRYVAEVNPAKKGASIEGSKINAIFFLPPNN